MAAPRPLKPRSNDIVASRDKAFSLQIFSSSYGLTNTSHCSLLSIVFKTDYDAFDGQRYGTLHGHADDLISIIDHVRKQRHVPGLKFTFVGRRQAGMVGLLASLRCPDAFKRLVLISSSPRYTRLFLVFLIGSLVIVNGCSL